LGIGGQARHAGKMHLPVGGVWLLNCVQAPLVTFLGDEVRYQQLLTNEDGNAAVFPFLAAPGNSGKDCASSRNAGLEVSKHDVVAVFLTCWPPQAEQI
jgi:hypothetical protein